MILVDVFCMHISQVVYSHPSGTVYAASRDRIIYSWRWPENEEEEEEEEEREAVENGNAKGQESCLKAAVPKVYDEPLNTMEGHTLGVTALACSTGEGWCVCVCVNL